MTDRVVEVVDAGLIPYREALEWQRRLAHERIDGRLDHDVLLLVEHPPVVTLGRSAHDAHLVDRSDIEVVEVERGGDVTYHGPGQLVGYPIVALTQYRRDLHWYLRTLEAALIEALATLGLRGERKASYTGVWTGGGARKIASIGVHVKQWVTWHGFALNVTTDLSQFERMVPCGIAGVEMTSVAREAGRGMGDDRLWEQSAEVVMRGFESAFGVRALGGAVR